MQTSWAHLLHALPLGTLPAPHRDKLAIRSPREPIGHPLISPESRKGLLEVNVPEVSGQTQLGSLRGLPPSPPQQGTPAGPPWCTCTPGPY